MLTAVARRAAPAHGAVAVRHLPALAVAARRLVCHQRRREQQAEQQHQQALRQLFRSSFMNSSSAMQLQQRGLHSTPARRDSTALVVAGLGLTGIAVAGRYTMIAIQEVQRARSRAAEEASAAAAQPKEPEPPAAEAAAGSAAAQAEAQATGGAATAKKSPLSGWFRNPLEKRFYDGGFEETMTRREAALILGVRESASPQRIKDAHRRILMLNHPDRGGSTYMAGKINAAKEILLKGKE
eukprot:TRINITY_DN3746_c0_g1_i1.p1 TRINITY_DN3746_c0_g1~~TRINITY_DN3746_c0_g1_i1.p1  ORF type:complete len:240 (-),score=66.48 TRINITY_DN3746_c0_g1_i1:95-814(-)